MWAFVVSLILIVGSWLLGKFTKLMTSEQSKLLSVSSILYVVFLVFFRSMLLSENIEPEEIVSLLFKNTIYYPLILYILWFTISTIITNKLPRYQNYIGFGPSSDNWISHQNEMFVPFYGKK
jgi:hypothetical protein